MINRSGFMLVEALISIAILFIILLAANNIVSTDATQYVTNENQTQRLLLNQQLLMIATNSDLCDANFANLPISNDSTDSIPIVRLGVNSNSQIVAQIGQVLTSLTSSLKVSDIRISEINQIDSPDFFRGNIIVSFTQAKGKMQIAPLRVPIFFDSSADKTKILSCRNDLVQCSQNGELGCVTNDDYVAGANLANNSLRDETTLDFISVMSPNPQVLLKAKPGYYDGQVVKTVFNDSNFIQSNIILSQGVKLFGLEAGIIRDCNNNGQHSCFTSNTYVSGILQSTLSQASSGSLSGNKVTMVPNQGVYVGSEVYYAFSALPTATPTPSISSTPIPTTPTPVPTVSYVPTTPTPASCGAYSAYINSVLCGVNHNTGVTQPVGKVINMTKLSGLGICPTSCTCTGGATNGGWNCNDDSMGGARLYLENKTRHANALYYKQRSNWVANSTLVEINSLYGSPLNHYNQLHATELIPYDTYWDVSNYSSFNQYYVAKAKLLNMQKYNNIITWNNVAVANDFAKVGLNACTHYCKYGKNEGLFKPTPCTCL